MKEKLKKEIGSRMRKIRKTLSYTQEKMVSHFDIGRANYSRIEKGEVLPGATILSVLKTKFNVSLDWLITNQGKMFLKEKDKNVDKDKVDMGKYAEETRELLSYMEKVPMVKHAILSYFIQYRLQHKKIIQQAMEEATSSVVGHVTFLSLA